MKSLHGYTYIHTFSALHTSIHTCIPTYIHTYRLGAYLTLSGFGNTAESKHNNSIATHTYSSEISWRLGENAANSLSQWSYPTTTLPQQPTTYMGYNSTSSINSSTVSSTSSQYHSVNRYISASLTAMLTVKNSETAVLISSKCRSSLFDNILNGIFSHTYKHIYIHTYTFTNISNVHVSHTNIHLLIHTYMYHARIYIHALTPTYIYYPYTYIHTVHTYIHKVRTFFLTQEFTMKRLKMWFKISHFCNLSVRYLTCVR
jgi:hypothetical protein